MHVLMSFFGMSRPAQRERGVSELHALAGE
jgi:hypothetical protein